MRVICKVNTAKLVKGSTYEVSRLNNKNRGSRSNLHIKGLGNYVVRNFTQMDGTALPEIDWEDPLLKSTLVYYIQNPENLKKGDILVCRYDSKYLDSGKKYKISEVNTTAKRNFKETKIKVEGFNRWLNTYRFRMPTQEESRDLSLNEIFDTVETLSVDRSVRKIDNLDDLKKSKVILGSIFSSILDGYRNNLNIIDWTIQKTGKKWELNQDDLLPYLNLTLDEIIKKME